MEEAMTPPDAIQVWIRGDKLFLGFEGHSVDIPITEPRRLITVLQARERAQRKNTVGTAGAPCQLQIYDAFCEAQSVARRDAERAKHAEVTQKKVKSAVKRYEKELMMKEFDAMLEAAGL